VYVFTLLGLYNRHFLIINKIIVFIILLYTSVLLALSEFALLLHNYYFLILKACDCQLTPSIEHIMLIRTIVVVSGILNLPPVFTTLNYPHVVLEFIDIHFVSNGVSSWYLFIKSCKSLMDLLLHVLEDILASRNFISCRFKL